MKQSKKILFAILALIFVMSCNDDDNVPVGRSSGPGNKTSQASSATNKSNMAQCPDCNQPTTCWETQYGPDGEVVWTYQIPCGTDTGGPGVPPPSPTPVPVTTSPTIYCPASNFPTAPKNGQLFKTSTAGSSCLSPIYYYSCSAGWVVPVSAIYGQGPTTNLYSGLHYQTDYNGTGILYVYLVNFAGNSTGWYEVVLDVRSSTCLTGA